MGDTSRRLSAAFATLAIATTALGFVALPAAAAPSTTVTNDQVTAPANSPTSSTTLSPVSTEITTPTAEAIPLSPAGVSTAEPTTSTATEAPQIAAKSLGTEATAGGSGTDVTSLSAMFNELSLVPEDTSTAYDRALFEHWIDADGNGCDTRQEVLIAESHAPVTYSSGCNVTAGQWHSYYDGATWTNPSDVDIDHLVPLEEAWGSGAYRWTPELRKAYANDLGWSRSLVAVTDNVNQSKGSQDPSTWLPAVNATDPKNCDYAIDWITTKWRWNLTADNGERDALNAIINGTSCGAIVIARPAKMDTHVDTFEGWPLYKIVYDSTIYELVTQQDGITQIAVPLTYERWANYYKFNTPTPASTDFVKYPWSNTVYAVTFWPGGEQQWMWTPLSFHQWQIAGQPTPRQAGWIKGSYYYKWGTSAEIFVEGADGVNHKLTYQEWSDSGFRSFEHRSNEGYLKLTWSPEFARMSDLSTGAGRPMAYAEWQEEAFPTPQSVQRITGDQFYAFCGSSTIWYAGPGMNRPVNFQEWQAAGSPNPAVRNAPCGGSGGGTTPPPPSQPSNPGDTKNCGDFATQAAAQQWFNTYYPYYGDVAQLDSNNDGIACESRP